MKAASSIGLSPDLRQRKYMNQFIEANHNANEQATVVKAFEVSMTTDDLHVLYLLYRNFI